MKNNIINSIILAIALSSSQVIWAQQNNIAKQRRIIDAALSTIESYSVWSAVADDEAHYEFQELFVSKDAPVYNDLLGIKQEDNLTAEEYSNTMRHALGNKMIYIKNIKNEGISFENEVAHVLISADKAISYIDSCGTYFSSSEFYRTDHHLKFKLVYDDQAKTCKIESITGEIDSPNKLHFPFFTFQSEDKRDSLLLYRGKRLAYNSFHQALLEGKPENGTFRYIDPSVAVKLKTDECNHVSAKYRPRKNRLKVHFDLGVGDAYKVDGTNGMKDDKNSTYNIGLDYGFTLPSKGMFKTGFFIGVGFSQSQLDLSYSNPDYAFVTSADVDGESYTRHYQDLSVRQSIKMTDFTIPLYADFTLQFSKFISLYLDLGARFNMNMSHKVDKSDGSAYIYGIYPQYDNLRMDEHWGYNGFGNRTFSKETLDNQKLIDFSSFTIDAFAGLGIRFNIPQTPLSIDLGVNYQMGLTDVIKSNAMPVALDDVSDPEHALIYNTISGTENTEHLRNLTESLSKVKRQSLVLSAGITFKF